MSSSILSISRNHPGNPLRKSKPCVLLQPFVSVAVSGGVAEVTAVVSVGCRCHQ